MMSNIAIIGAGLMGRLLALSLNRQGYKVTLFDKDTKQGKHSAAHAAAGLLTPLGEAMHSSINTVEMGFSALALWPKILSTLHQDSFFQQKGSLVVSHEQDIADYQRFKHFLAKNYTTYPQTSLNREQLFKLEPELAIKFSSALYLPQEGQLANRELLTALQQQLKIEGVTWLSSCEVIHIKPMHLNAGCEIGFLSSAQQTKCQWHSFDLAIDCRGTGAKAHCNAKAKTTAELADLRAVRGELFHLFAPEVHIDRPVRLMHPRYQLYIAPKKQGHYVIGATEIESDNTSPMTVRSAMELLSAAYSVHSGFAEAHITQHVSQVRPAFSDNQTKIIVENGLIQVNGLYRHGFLIAPVVLAQVIEHVDNVLLKQQKSWKNYQYAHWLPITSQAINHPCNN